MPPISLLIKPASSLCNLRCKYCFYHSVSSQRQTESYGLMSTDMLEELIIKALNYAEGFCTFAFQGGEPTLVGLEFYQKLIELQKKHNKKGVQINNTLQTNGVVIDGNWAKFLACNKFLVGLSLDGPKDIHDKLRVDARGAGSFKAVMNATRLFDKYKVEYNILTVVNAMVARHPSQVYNFFKKNGFRYLQFIQCLDPLGEKPGRHEHSLTPKRYSQFLKAIFDLWYNDLISNNYISIRTFDNYVHMAAGYPPESCNMAGICTCYFVIESNGGVYPCDFYVLDKWYLGNIQEHSFDKLIKSETANRFVETSKHIDEHCKGCKHYSLCRGGCRRTREPFSGGKPDLNYYCLAYKEFFDYAGDRINQIARGIRR